MVYVVLRRKIQDLIKSKSTLLWLEGSQYERVNKVQMKGEKLILSLANGATRLIQFEKYSFTSVGIQFWSGGRPGVLYKWDLLENTNKMMNGENLPLSTHQPDDDPTPPDMAA